MSNGKFGFVEKTSNLHPSNLRLLHGYPVPRMHPPRVPGELAKAQRKLWALGTLTIEGVESRA